MNEILTKFRNAVSESTDLQEKVKAGADLVTLGKENGYEFTHKRNRTLAGKNYKNPTKD